MRGNRQNLKRLKRRFFIVSQFYGRSDSSMPFNQKVVSLLRLQSHILRFMGEECKYLFEKFSILEM